MTPILFPLRLPTGFTENDTQTFVVDSSVIGAKLVNKKVSNLKQGVRISFRSFRATENLVRTLTMLQHVKYSLCVCSIACVQNDFKVKQYNGGTLDTNESCHGKSILTISLYLQNWSKPTCVFWNFSAADNRGNWSVEGCSLASEDVETGEVTCECDHLTNFAVLVVR